MCRHASWVQLGTPLKIGPTGTFHLTLEYTPSIFLYIQINFLIFMWKLKTGFFCLVFFFFVFAPCGRNSVYLPHHFWASLVVKTLFVKKKNRDWQFGVSRSVCLFPSFPPHKKKKNSTLRRRDWVLRISVTISSSQGAALLRCFPLIPLKPLGPLIRKQSALMFGPLADELYLWVVWEDAEEYIHMRVCVCVCITKCAFPAPPPKKGRKTHTHKHAECHTQLEAWERYHSIQNRRTTNRGPL